MRTRLNAYGIEGDAGELVQVDSDVLAQTPATLVLALGHHVTELESPRYPSYLILMVLGGNAHTEVVSAYKVLFIPFELVPLLLGKVLTPLQAMRIIHPFLSNQGLIETCAPPLFDTLRAAGTVPSIIAGNLTLIKPGPSFWSEPGLTMYMKSKVLYRDLPGLNRLPTSGDLALTAAMVALTDHQLRLSEGLDKRCSQPVRGTWCPLYTKHLLLLCGKSEEAALPPIYQAWAQKTKHGKTHTIFQSQVASCAAELFIQAPLFTTAVLKRFQDGNFYGTDHFDVADGILPLAFTPRKAIPSPWRTHKSCIRPKTKVYIPVDWTEATTQLGSYLAVLATILGVNHEVVQGYQKGLMRLKLQQMPLRRAIADKLGELITPAIVKNNGDLKWVSSQLVSFDNPDGTINNSDLELAGSIAHNDVLAHAACLYIGNGKAPPLPRGLQLTYSGFRPCTKDSANMSPSGTTSPTLSTICWLTSSPHLTSLTLPCSIISTPPIHRTCLGLYAPSGLPCFLL
eukprot:jgi/Psemu1/25748/gm1.25748_g